MCRAFPTTLKGLARVWFNKLTPNMVSTFKELSGHFITHFIRGQRYKRSSASLLNIKQWEDVSLRSYVTRFNKETLLIDEANNKVLVTAFTNGLQSGEFIFSIYRNGSKTMADMCTRPRNTWMLKMQWLPRGTDQKRGKNRMTLIWTEEESRPKWAIEGMIGDRNLRWGGRWISLLWIPRWTKSSCR